MERPSHKELAGKLKTAGALLESGRWAAGDPAGLAANFTEMDLFFGDKQQAALRGALAELRPEDYHGKRPPERSYKPVTKGAEMFAFSWESKRFGKKMYLKFALVGAGAGQTMYVYSFHASRERTGVAKQACKEKRPKFQAR